MFSHGSIISPHENDPEKQAWLANFYTENHLAYEAFPDEVASPEQLRFMVYMEDEPYYYPCSDEMFNAIIEKRAAEILPVEYLKVWDRIEPLVKQVVEDEYRKRFLLSLLHIKFRHETASLVILPSRLEKRLLQIFTQVSEIHRPQSRIRETWNRRMRDLLNSQVFKQALNDPEGVDLNEDTPLDEVNFNIQLLKLKRLIALTNYPELWQSDIIPSVDRLKKMMNTPVKGDGWYWLKEFLKSCVRPSCIRYLLWIGASAGEVILDLAMIQILMGMGVKVIMAVKRAYYYNAVTIADVLEDPILQQEFSNAEIILDSHISKKNLLKALKSDKMLFVISDGTQERFNPLLASVTFARAFKEVDAVVSRSSEDRPCIFDTGFRFTRDILSITRENEHKILFEVKHKHKKAIRFSEADLRAKAQALIDQLRLAKQQGKTIMFYSAIVGSIPNQLETAKRVLNTFVSYLRSRQEGVYVINPAEHFEPGMDADDIMYMWEIVQRSGLIDIWRFQTVDDIEKAFELMGEKIPPEWVGKDATYSTGCTMEMKIAQEVQKEHPEMQIIGPPLEKFLRRKEYGIGKFYDRALDG